MSKPPSKKPRSAPVEEAPPVVIEPSLVSAQAHEGDDKVRMMIVIPQRHRKLLEDACEKLGQQPSVFVANAILREYVQNEQLVMLRTIHARRLEEAGQE